MVAVRFWPVPSGHRLWDRWVDRSNGLHSSRRTRRRPTKHRPDHCVERVVQRRRRSDPCRPRDGDPDPPPGWRHHPRHRLVGTSSPRSRRAPPDRRTSRDGPRICISRTRARPDGPRFARGPSGFRAMRRAPPVLLGGARPHRPGRSAHRRQRLEPEDAEPGGLPAPQSEGIESMRSRMLCRAVAAGFTALLLVSGSALAETLAGDGDLVTAGIQSTVNVGTVAPGEDVRVQVAFELACTGRATSTPDKASA